MARIADSLVSCVVRMTKARGLHDTKLEVRIALNVGMDLGIPPSIYAKGGHRLSRGLFEPLPEPPVWLYEGMFPDRQAAQQAAEKMYAEFCSQLASAIASAPVDDEFELPCPVPGLQQQLQVVAVADRLLSAK